MKNKLTQILEILFVAVTLGYLLNYLFFSVFIDYSSNVAAYFLYGMAAAILIAFGLIVLALMIYSIKDWGKHSSLAGRAQRILIMSIVLPFIYLAFSPFMVDFSADMVKVSHIDLKNLCSEESKTERFISTLNQELTINNTSRPNAEEINILINVKADTTQKTFIKDSKEAKNLCSWNQSGKTIFIEDVTVKTPFESKKHYGKLFIAAPK